MVSSVAGRKWAGEVVKALVTGASGFLGSHLVDELLEDGNWEVRVLVRSSSNLRWLDGKSVEKVFGDVTSSAEDLAQALEGVDVVFHAAGLTKALAKERLLEVNSQGTANLLKACVSNSSPPEKFVLVSSAGAQGPSGKNGVCTERDEPAPVTDYGRSKLAAEAYVHQYQDRMDCRIIRPGGIYGPRDMELLPAFKVLQKGLKLRFGIRNRLVNMAYVRDITHALVLAANADVNSGEVFLVGGENASQDEVLDAVAQAVGREDTLCLPLPSPVVRFAAAVSSLTAMLSGKARIFTLGNCKRMLAHSWAMDLSKARSGLNYTPQWSLPAGMGQTAKWYASEGLL